MNQTENAQRTALQNKIWKIADEVRGAVDGISSNISWVFCFTDLFQRTLPLTSMMMK